jgi:hypothetical protein
MLQIDKIKIFTQIAITAVVLLPVIYLLCQGQGAQIPNFLTALAGTVVGYWLK